MKMSGDGCLPLKLMMHNNANRFSTLYMMNSKKDPNRTNPAWSLGPGFPIPVQLKKHGWKGLLSIAQPGVRLCNEDHELSEKATQNHIQDEQYWTGQFRSQDAGPVMLGPTIGLRRHSGQNAGRSGIEYSGLGIGLRYIDPLMPMVCTCWGLVDVHNRSSRSTLA